MPDDSRWVAHYDGVGRDILNYDGSAPDETALPEADTRKHHRVETHPDIVLQDHRLGWFHGGNSSVGVAGSLYQDPAPDSQGCARA
jgi:hypothetical protein